MTEGCFQSPDRKVVDFYLDKYNKMNMNSSNTIISSHEVEKAISRIFHQPAENEITWIGGEQKISSFIETLRNFK